MSIRRLLVLTAALALAVIAGIAIPGAMQTGLQATGPFIYLSTDSADTTAFSALAPRTASPPSVLIPLGNSKERDRCLEVSFFGTGADNATINYKVTVLDMSDSVTTAGVRDDYQEQSLGEGIATLGTTVGTATRGATSAHRLADTLTFTASTFCTQMVSAYGGTAPVLYSPADNTEARIWIPETGNARYVKIYFDLGTATAANCYVKYGT